MYLAGLLSLAKPTLVKCGQCPKRNLTKNIMEARSDGD